MSPRPVSQLILIKALHTEQQRNTGLLRECANVLQFDKEWLRLGMSRILSTLVFSDLLGMYL